MHTGGETGIYRWLSAGNTIGNLNGFLNGGMLYDSSNGQLHIPKNGIYYMYATIRFRFNKASLGHLDDLVVRITVNTTGNCFRKLFNVGRNSAANPESHVIIPSSTKGTSQSIHIGGVSRLCKGDFIFLSIKNMPSILEINNNAFPTNFGAFMIAPSCDEDEPTPPTSSPATTQTSPATDSQGGAKARCSFRTCQ